MNKLSQILYIIAVVVLLILLILVSVADFTFSGFVGRSITNTAITLFLIGLILTIVQKKKEDKKISADVGIVIGISIVLVSRFFT